MQEFMKDGSEGKTVVKNTIEDLIPHIKKSLEDPNVKFVKVFKGTMVVPSNAGPGFEQKDTFVAGEEKKETVDSFSEFLKEEKERIEKETGGVVDEHLFKRKKEVKKSNLLYPITVLEAERDNIPCLPGSQVAQLNKAIEILCDERYKIEKKAFRDSFVTKDDIGKKFKERKSRK